MIHEVDDVEDLFENAPCGYVSAGSDGRITRANATFSAWLGRDRSELVGHRFQDLLNIAGKIYYETHFAPLMRMQGFFNEVALDLLRADGTTLPVLVNAVERRDEQGALRFIRITIFNASDRRRYERELLEARRTAEKTNAELLELNRTLEERIGEAVEARMKSEAALHQAQKMEAVGQLTGGIAHDFNNMLAVIVSALNLIERRLNRGEDVSQFIAAAKDGATRAASLIQRLLTFSRQQTLSPEPLDANQMVAEMSELLQRTLGEIVRLETVLAGGLWRVQADKNLLENAILNLAINARDAMPEGGRLTIETTNCHLDEAYAAEHATEPGQYVMVAVTDTGTGMTPDVMAKAFDPFFTTKGPGKGTGLGLSQVFGFVKQSGGHIKIYSEPGHGTSIKIYLPRLSGAVEAPKPSRAKKLASGSGSEVVLLVEDDEQLLALTAQMLRDLGYGVIEARGGAEALAALSKHPEIRLLFTNVVTPDMNGRRLAEEAQKRRPDLKLLFTTGYTRDAVVHNGVLDPGANLLQKPASVEQLAAKVRAVLDG
ncbi:ATP-binding protein [Mesorhizobium sp.]|uniref:PAS domain-containing hybrid sensor histidine kinase/response regulator n=1 Tax=Mesorhizobium sp. TaxID=1871066 RepID=UPI000FE6384F|nr:MAG: PAS domain-containing hybrid sensor histidine kinase/response regulator [Mesorhizobium sp.]RWM46597.1 MAG: PAS domain-containing hybrid sensor histidine kinase/response regulator [Mesorhizobium sp.]RWM50467.1 MAG: PAS domain-containing hybrid sensor histidine kinase/response regulator [Mesorhizobium sp.]RWM55546.1 MAG: PAS domain-containing hybrid sensor histidine kinase/response regulator [Mesorhizobium sp.]RWM95949.1 MAG: PAS domain-containing hybrid sensor histidine kinase/response r